MDTKWFDPTSINSMVVFSNTKHPNDPLNYYDVSSETVDLTAWINAASIDHVEKMNVFSVQIMQHMNMPIFIAFTDTQSSKYGARSLELLKIMLELAFDYPHYLFGYFDDHTYDPAKKDIGITWTALPSLALFNPPEDTPVVFPKDKEITKENLIIFFSNGIDSAINKKDVFEPISK
jgi:hypothetical protein